MDEEMEHYEFENVLQRLWKASFPGCIVTEKVAFVG